MTVVEALPGSGWYTKILLPFLGRDGHLIGDDYALDMYPKFDFFNDEDLAKKNSLGLATGRQRRNPSATTTVPLFRHT